MTIYTTILRDVSIQNKYYVFYCRIVERAQERASCRKTAQSLMGYVEGHHIVPKSFGLGGEKDPQNIVYLTAKEHIMAHRLLCKFVTEEKCLLSSLRAFHCMTYVDNGGANKRFASIHHLAKAREAAKIASSVKRGIQGVPEWFTETDDLDVFEDAIRNHVEQGMSDPKIGELYGVTAACIHIWRSKFGIQNRRWQLRDEAWLRHHYVDLQLSAGKIAEIIGCTGTAVQQYLNKFGIQIRDSYTRQRLRADR